MTEEEKQRHKEKMKQKLLLMAQKRIEKELRKRQSQSVQVSRGSVMLEHQTDYQSVNFTNNNSKQFRVSYQAQASQSSESYSLERIKEENRRHRMTTMSLIDQPNKDVLNSTIRWKDRPFKWRKDSQKMKDRAIVADY